MPYPRAINIRGFNASPGVSTIKYDTDAATTLPNGEYSFTAKAGAAKATFTLKGGDGSQYYVPGSPGTTTFTPNYTSAGVWGNDGVYREFRTYFQLTIGANGDPSGGYYSGESHPAGWVLQGTPGVTVWNNSPGWRVTTDTIWQNISDTGYTESGHFGGTYTTPVAVTTTGGTPGYYQPTSGSNSTAITAEKSLSANAGYGQGSVGTTVTGDFDLKINGFYGNSISISDNMTTIAVGCFKYSFDLINSGAVYIFR